MNLRWYHVLGWFAKQSTVPALVALAYALWDKATASTPRSASEIVKNFSVAYFFLMWFVGQYFRIHKQLRDSTALDDIKTAVADIRERLQRLATTTPVAPLEQQIENVRNPAAKRLLGEALKSAAAGSSMSAGLAAAVAFEEAIRASADQLGVEYRPVTRLIRRLVRHLGKSVTEDLLGLWQLRNSLVHSTAAHLGDIPPAHELIETFLWGINILEEQTPYREKQAVAYGA